MPRQDRSDVQAKQRGEGLLRLVAKLGLTAELAEAAGQILERLVADADQPALEEAYGSICRRRRPIAAALQTSDRMRDTDPGPACYPMATASLRQSSRYALGRVACVIMSSEL